jgi:hypothetical protein
VKKIPTMYVRDWGGDRSRVLDEPHPECDWVFAGEGTATRKLDGTCCMVRGGQLFKRRELKTGDAVPVGFEQAGHDEETGKTVGWAPVGPGPEDRYHREAWADGGIPDGTYELLGPKIQGNPEGVDTHRLALHGVVAMDAPRTFDALRAWLATQDIEGIVFHHPDGRMAKIKKRDFGLRRKP